MFALGTDTTMVDYFVSGTGAVAPGLLDGLLPGWPGGVAEHYVKSRTHPDAVVLDPFAVSDVPIREAAAAGRRVIATNHNPLVVLLLRERLSPPDPAGLRAAVTRLGDSLKRGVPMREHLDQLYRTRCPACRHQAVADYFVWSREPADPRQKWVTCPGCHEAGLAAVDDDDLGLLDEVETRGLHYWYLLHRVVPPTSKSAPGDGPHAHAEMLLELYTPRALYAIADLLMKIEATFDEDMQSSLKAILLTCLGAASNLSHPDNLAATGQGSTGHPAGSAGEEAETPMSGLTRSPFAGLRPPPRFAERNVWRLFEAAAHQRAVAAAATPSLPLQADLHWVTRLPLSPEGLAWVHTLGAGAVGRGLAPESVSLVLTTPPRPDPVFWSLAFLWTGWLFGPDQAARLKDLALQKWPDWAWYQSAMTRALHALHPALRFDAACGLVLSASSPQQAFAICLAALGAGYDIETWQHRATAEHQFLVTPVPLHTPAASEPEALRTRVMAESAMAAADFLRARGEPVGTDTLHIAIWQRLVRTGLLETAQASLPASRVLGWLKRTVGEGLEMEQATELLPIPGDDGRPAGWWLSEGRGHLPDPLGDRVELAVLAALRDAEAGQASGVEEGAFTQSIYRRFKGPLTPAAGLVRACLAAYGEEVSAGHWRLRSGEREVEWQGGKKACIGDLLSLGERLGYRSRAGERDLDVVWEEDGELWATFTLATTAEVARFLPQADSPLPRMEARWRNLVIPAARTGLWQHRLSTQPWLAQMIKIGGWTFVKVEHLVALADSPTLTRHDLTTIIGLVPPVERGEGQLPLF